VPGRFPAKPRKILIGAPRTGEKDESEVRWLISYSDFMMQLVCVFILLYSVSSLDKGRMARVAAGYRASVGIGELAAHETGTPGEWVAVGDRSLLGGEVGGGDLLRDVRYRIEMEAGGLRVAFSEPIFDAGSAELTAKGGEALDAAARILRAYAGRIVVTGAGDGADDPEAMRRATARARTAVDRLARAGLDPRFITAAAAPQREPRRVTIEIRTD
jgi:flagellar motor protein MotB